MKTATVIIDVYDATNGIHVEAHHTEEQSRNIQLAHFGANSEEELDTQVDKMNHGDHETISNFNQEVFSFNVLDIIDTPILEEGVKPYLFEVCEVIGDTNTTTKRVAYTDNPRATAKDLVIDESRDFDALDDEDMIQFEKLWDEENLSVESSTVVYCQRWTPISPAQAEIILLANAIKSNI